MRLLTWKQSLEPVFLLSFYLGMCLCSVCKQIFCTMRNKQSKMRINSCEVNFFNALILSLNFREHIKTVKKRFALKNETSLWSSLHDKQQHLFKLKMLYNLWNWNFTESMNDFDFDMTWFYAKAINLPNRLFWRALVFPRIAQFIYNAFDLYTGLN